MAAKSLIFDLNALVMEIKTAQDCVQQIKPFTKRYRNFDLSAAYKVAQFVHRAKLSHGATPVGRKIGFTNPRMWTKFGVHEPIWAFMYDTTVVHLASTNSTCALDKFSEPRIEPEIVFGFRAAPPTDASLGEVLDTIDWVAHGFEIVQSHFPGWRFEAADTVADCSLHGILLIGPPQPLRSLGRNLVPDLESFSLSLSCNGDFVESGIGSNVLGSPLAAIGHLVSVLKSQPDSPPLQEGEIVTTGTITTAHSIFPGEIWQSELEGISLPRLTVEFT